MDRQIANNVKKQFNFFDKVISRDVLKLIRKNPARALKTFSDYEKEISWIIHRYNHHKDAKTDNKNPRNIIFYKIINEIYPDFTWKVTSNGTVIKHKIEGIQPSLLSYLFNHVPSTTFTGNSLLPDGINAKICPVFDEYKIKKINTEPSVFENWVKRGLAGEKLTVISPVCPDYAAELISPPNAHVNSKLSTIRHRFTFDGLGEGLGVTATYLLQVLPSLHELFAKQLNLDIEFIVAYGNFEGYSAKNLKRLNLTEQDFQSQIDASIRFFNKTNRHHAKAIAFDDIVGGKVGWMKMLKNVRESVDEKLMANIDFLKVLEATAEARSGLYDRWCNGRMDSNHYMKMIIPQVVEYATMGLCVRTSPFKNPLILGADDHKMGKFYHLLTTLPVIYLPRIYE